MRGETCEHNLPIAEDCMECLKLALRNYRSWYADHFEDFDDEVNKQLLCLDNEAAFTLHENPTTTGEPERLECVECGLPTQTDDDGLCNSCCVENIECENCGSTENEMATQTLCGWCSLPPGAKL